ncbi:endonuclease/exonuclease/phosphatase family protein [Babesia caballi]|uniref:Endonuclease/exonuclease/phosphatase family protein n=1 Tax=Babesia caballi TaxID=5871 RepID=A0AAV4LX77_BABCB|nr:endonuclease/exonuclease/phosphatase family protein [Babesia caballi]
MSYVGSNYALVKFSPESENITMAINWHGLEMNLDRKKSEAIKTTIARLKRSLHKISSSPSKRHKNSTDEHLLSDASQFNRKKGQGRVKPAQHESDTLSITSDGSCPGPAGEYHATATDDDYSVSFLTDMFKPFDDATTLETVTQNASFISINDTLIQVYTNVFRIEDVKVGPKAMVGCPVSLHIQSEGPWRYEDLLVEWVDDADRVVHRGTIYVPSEGMETRHVKAKVSHKQLKWNTVESDFCEVYNVPENRWQQERVVTFNATPMKSARLPLQSDIRHLRVMSFNILSPTYVATEESIERFFPYCAPEWLDSSYRKPLILREILMIKPQVLCLQECATSAYRDYMEPVLGQHYHSWLTIKNQASDEGCCIFLQRDLFDILDVQSVTFKERVRRPEYSEVLTRIGAPNWLNYNEATYFDRYHTVYQMGCFRNTLADGKNFLFIANTHLYFHPNGRHIRLLQAYVMLNELQRFKEQCAKKHGFDLDSESSTIICGDFNSFKNEGTFQLITHGWVPSDHGDFAYGLRFGNEKFNPTDHNTKYPQGRGSEVATSPCDTGDRLEVAECSGYQDAYSGQELPFTNFVKTFSGTLDYIFHSRNIQVRVACKLLWTRVTHTRLYAVFCVLRDDSWFNTMCGQLRSDRMSCVCSELVLVISLVSVPSGAN